VYVCAFVMDKLTPVVYSAGDSLPPRTARRHPGQGVGGRDKDRYSSGDILDTRVELDTRPRGGNRRLQLHAKIYGRPSNT